MCMTIILTLIRLLLSKKFLLVGMLLMFTGCGAVPTSNIEISTDVTYKIFEVKNCVEERSCYFQYPYGASISESSSGVNGGIEYDNCKIMYGTDLPINLDQYDSIKFEKDDKVYQTVTEKEGGTVYYIASFKGNNYKFWLVEEKPSSCKDFWQQIVDSFTDKPVFVSDEYSFRAGILSGYKVDYLPNGQGFTMVHRIAGDELKAEYEKELETWPSGAHGLPYNEIYNVEMGITAYENVQEYSDIADLLKKEYPGYTMEFAPNGVFIGEDQQMFAVRNFVTLSENGKYIYRAYFRIPSAMYNFHKDEFDKWTETIETF